MNDAIAKTLKCCKNCRHYVISEGGYALNMCSNTWKYPYNLTEYRECCEFRSCSEHKKMLEQEEKFNKNFASRFTRTL